MVGVAAEEARPQPVALIVIEQMCEWQEPRPQESLGTEVASWVFVPGYPVLPISAGLKASRMKIDGAVGS